MKMFEYQNTNRFFAMVTGKMEALCEEEIKELGGTNCEQTYRGVYFTADRETLYRINYKSRLSTRVLSPLASFTCHNSHDLMSMASQIKWDSIFSLNQTFAITASCANSKGFTNSLYAAQCLKDGIADYFRDKFGIRPDVKKNNPDVRFNIHIDGIEAVISLDTSGESLHKRGYRLLSGEAPMQETLAAALIKISGWNGERTLWDPMCGSGTILCEALMHYCRIPAQSLRTNFGFMHLPDFESSTWLKVKTEADAQIRELPQGMIKGSDKSEEALSITKSNLSRLPNSENIELKLTPFQEVNGFENGIMITNPPYGIRLSNAPDVKILFKELGDFLKQKCSGTSAFIYVGDTELKKYIGLKPTKKYPLNNAKLEGQLLKIDIYSGSKKKKYQTES
jgi:putative N6-adenine-specific DNA methylase